MSRAVRPKPLPVEDPNPDDLGPAMLALEPKQRRFVLAYVADASDASRAAEAAGYSVSSGAHRVSAWRMLRSPKIISAIKEEADKRLNSDAFIAVSALSEIAADPEHKDRYKAAASILSRTGFPETTQQAITVEEDPFTKKPTRELLLGLLSCLRAAAPHLVSDLSEHSTEADLFVLVDRFNMFDKAQKARHLIEARPSAATQHELEDSEP